MTQQLELSPDTLFEKCRSYAEFLDWKWEVRRGIGYFTVSEGFSFETIIRIELDDDPHEPVLINSDVIFGIPHAFYKTATALHCTTKRFFVFHEDDSIMWQWRYPLDTFSSEGEIDDLFVFMQREFFLVRSLVSLYKEQQREIPITSIMGLGPETEFDRWH